MIHKNFIFSTALIDAVETEKNAIYPRIVLHPKLKDKFLQLSNNPLKEFVREVFVQDWSGNVFLNPFNNASRNIKALDSFPTDVLNQLENELNRTQKRMINRINKSFSYLLDDKQYNSIARNHISKRINKYKNRNQSIYEKYLWKRNFLNWGRKQIF